MTVAGTSFAAPQISAYAAMVVSPTGILEPL
jgi:hypothetical protein